jgi:hypothetical protein
MERSVEENTLIVAIKEKNINISLTLDHTNVFKSSFDSIYP